jgi:hypothetical protein
MRIEGSWLTGADGTERPVVAVRLPTSSGAITRNFLVDSAADRTVLCRDTLDALALPALPAATGLLGGFLDPAASDMDILGRDVLNNFDVILSYRRREVLLLAPNHAYQVLAP